MQHVTLLIFSKNVWRRLDLGGGVKLEEIFREKGGNTEGTWREKGVNERGNL